MSEKIETIGKSIALPQNYAQNHCKNRNEMNRWARQPLRKHQFVVKDHPQFCHPVFPLPKLSRLHACCFGGAKSLLSLV